MGKPRQRCVLAICGDPGGAAAVAPVIAALRAEGRTSVQALAYNQAVVMWTKRGLAFDELSSDITHSEAAALFGAPHAALLLTGTTVGPVELEKRFIAAALETGVPSLTVLDHWANYTPRFSDETGRLAYVPDKIAVMDNRARDEMVAEGFNPSHLVITGQPAFDDLAMWRERCTSAQRAELRMVLGVKPGELVVMFASEPISIDYGTDPCSPRFKGYTEHTVLNALVSALDNISDRSGKEIMLVVCPHPREKVNSFHGLRGRSVRVVPSTAGASRDVAMAADLVTGMSTVLLVETCYLGCITVSLQLGVTGLPVLPTIRSGLSQAVYRAQEVEPALERLLLDESARMAALARLSKVRPDGDATKRVVKLIYEMI